jgi:hypothetical protein
MSATVNVMELITLGSTGSASPAAQEAQGRP